MPSRPIRGRGLPVFGRFARWAFVVAVLGLVDSAVADGCAGELVEPLMLDSPVLDCSGVPEAPEADWSAGFAALELDDGEVEELPLEAADWSVAEATASRVARSAPLSFANHRLTRSPT